MPTARYAMSCGLVKNSSGVAEEVVVFGGNNKTHNLDTVEIYSLGEKKWRPGQHRLPAPSSLGNTLQYGETFLSVGGSDTVYKYEPGTESWTPMTEKLDGAKYGVAPFLVHPGEFPECA